MSAGLKSALRTGDEVIVVAGKNKGEKGRIASVDTQNNRIVVEGVNIVKRHVRATRVGQDAGIITKEAPIHASNVMLADPKTGKPSRVGYKVEKDGRKVRIAKKSGETLDN